jgi:hypothetical protein
MEFLKMISFDADGMMNQNAILPIYLCAAHDSQQRIEASKGDPADQCVRRILSVVSSSHVIFLASALARSRVYSLSLPEPNTTSFSSPLTSVIAPPISFFVWTMFPALVLSYGRSAHELFRLVRLDGLASGHWTLYDL